MTPFQMALIASSSEPRGQANETEDRDDIPPQMFAQVLTRDQARRCRDKSTVTEEPGGTAVLVRAKLAGTGITTGGKTGTADRDWRPGLQPGWNQENRLKSERRRRLANGSTT